MSFKVIINSIYTHYKHNIIYNITYILLCIIKGGFTLTIFEKEVSDIAWQA